MTMTTKKVLLALSWVSFSCQFVSAQLKEISSGCTCIGGEVVLQCTTVGSGFTEYNVTGCPFGRLNLPHIGVSGQPAVQECITTEGARIIATAKNASNGGTFVSVLNITAFPNGSITVECYHEVGKNRSLIGNITLKTAIPLPPDNITLLSSNPPTFKWRRPPLPNGCMVNYKINSSNCGACPSTVSDTTVACQSVVSTVEQDCHFSIQAMICGGTVKSTVRTFIDSKTSVTSITTTDAGITQPSNDLLIAVIVVITIIATATLFGVIIAVIICIIRWKYWHICRRSRVKRKLQTYGRTQGLEEEHTDSGSEMKSLLCELRSEMTQMREFQQKFEKRLEEKDKELERKNQELENKNRIISENQEKIDKNIKEMQEVKGENENLIQKVKVLEDENSRLRAENEQLKRDTSELRAMVETINQEKKKLLKLQEDVQKLNNDKASQEDVYKIQQQIQAMQEMANNDDAKNLKPQQTTQMKVSISSESKTSRFPKALQEGDSFEHQMLLENISQSSSVKEGVHLFKNRDHVEEARTDSVQPKETCRSISDDNNAISTSPV